MKKYDIIILTDRRYLDFSNPAPYVQNVLKEDTYIREALEEEGLKTGRLSWDDANFDWSQTKAVLFRTTWDYFDRFDEFSAWLDKVSKQTRLLNSETIIRWNLDKRYFLDLEAKGIYCTPTRFIEKNEKTSLKELHSQTGWEETVLKPCVSGSSRDTFKLNPSIIEDHEAVFKELIQKKAMMLQPFQQNIVLKGEISIMVMGGEFSHAVLKVAKAGDFRVQDDFGGSVQLYHPTEEEIAFAENTVKVCSDELPSYARVDIFTDNDGNLALAELELIEPELWFRICPNAAKLLAAYIKKTHF
ncbi:hypothetical protein GWK08_08125 [Leptobacterium flavescens]|uniref:Prokaryotic glutathione synthetase ATP-binding domain-containing protein n=1 Tax=Leptobacterium flavescens TaxID=472055 RepID=A0A6P0ULV5_9FLAO|nr:hypothetical protein [Leptobacterium flavescens]NER13400.1 hypothetical protein [Leptobacterium flavescens]